MPVIGDQVGLTIDRIVLATDFSPASEAATDYARGLAKRFSSNLTIAHVVDLSVSMLTEQVAMGIPIDDMRRTSSENLERLLNDLNYEGIRATAHTLEGRNPAAAIVGFAQQLKADLIITGTHSRHGISKWILGSCAEGIIRHADCPVLTIGPMAKKPTKEAISFNSIILATDLSPGAAKKAAVALALGQDSMAKIYLCHVLEHPGKDISENLELQFKFEAALQNLIPQSSFDWCNTECMVEQGEVAPHILKTAKEVGADLIVLGARRSSSWFAHLGEGVVGQVLMHSESPVMTICST